MFVSRMVYRPISHGRMPYTRWRTGCQWERALVRPGWFWGNISGWVACSWAAHRSNSTWLVTVLGKHRLQNPDLPQVLRFGFRVGVAHQGEADCPHDLRPAEVELGERSVELLFDRLDFVPGQIADVVLHTLNTESDTRLVLGHGVRSH